MIQEPTRLTPTLRIQAGLRRSSGIRIGLVIAAIIVLAVSVVMAMAANSPSLSPNTILAAGASASPDAAAKPNSAALDGPRAAGNHGPGDPGRLKGGPGGPGKGPGGPGGPGKGPITIHAISGSQISLATEDGWTRTITATSTTVITKGGQTITVLDLKVGDEVHFRQTRNTDGSFTITAIDIPTPRAGGEVSSIDGNNITVKRKDGSTRVITVTSSTVYMLGPNPGTKADVKVGTDIDAQGTVNGDSFTATAVRIRLAHIGGEVTAKTTDSITIQNHDLTKNVIHVTSSTTYKVKGKDPAALSDIAVGDKVNAEGTKRSDGSLDAISVHGGPVHGGLPKGEKPPIAPA